MNDNAEIAFVCPCCGQKIIMTKINGQYVICNAEPVITQDQVRITKYEFGESNKDNDD